LCVEFTSLHFGAVSFTDRGLGVGGTFFRHAPDAITRVNEQEEDEDKRNLQSILDFRHLFSNLFANEGWRWYDWRGGNELEEVATPGKWEREDEETEDCHFEHKESKDLEHQRGEGLRRGTSE
jgi:hypothetical protein